MVVGVLTPAWRNLMSLTTLDLPYAAVLSVFIWNDIGAEGCQQLLVAYSQSTA